MIFKKGFSLIECLIAMSVLAISSLATLKLYTYLEIEKANAAYWIKASTLAKSTLSQLQQVNTDYICDNGAKASFKQIENCGLKLAENSIFTIKTTVEKNFTYTDKAGQKTVFLKQLGILISWQDRRNEKQSLSLPVTLSIYTNKK